MKFTINWLKKYVDFDLSAAELADRLTMLGLEVDVVEPLFPNIEQIRVARVVSIKKHPNADNLSLCDVMVGDDSKRIVCGASNVRVGMLTPIALAGAQMPSGLLIKRSKIRGEDSEGMLCSGAELGILHECAGLMDLPESSVCGETLNDALGLVDTMIEVDITPNRADCTSLIGLAREVAGVTGCVLKCPIQDVSSLPSSSENFAVEIHTTDACPRYAARLLKNVKIGPSPWWLKRLLLAVGLRPINNVVDITNFVMLEYGQPLHAFDFSKINKRKIVVRKAVVGETLSTIDGVNRILDPEILVICDADKPVAIAGVMGGENSEVTDKTTEILLESAYFNPTIIRRTSRALKLSTDASYRFERGVDPNGAIVSLKRATQLMIECCGAVLVDDGIDYNTGFSPPLTINLRVSRTCACLGISLGMDEITDLVTRIGIKVKQLDLDTLEVTVPSFRVDLCREIDLIEEVARLNGYGKIIPSLPVVPMSLSRQEPSFMLSRKLANIMVALGSFEAINYSFTSERYCDLLGLLPADPLRNQLKILNPLADDQEVMRSMLLPGLLENIKHNFNRQTSDISLFEIGKVFSPIAGQEQPLEALRLGCVFSGRPGVGAPMLHYGDRSFDIYDLKGIVEIIMAQIGVDTAHFVVPELPPPYADHDFWLTMRLEERQLGSFGKLEASTLKRLGLKKEVYFLELDLDALATIELESPMFTPLSKFPSVSWDLAVVVPDMVGAGTIVEAIKAKAFPFISDVQIFDIYRGQPIAEGLKSVALSITYHSDGETLDDKTVDQIHRQVIDMIEISFNGRLRDV